VLFVGLGLGVGNCQCMVAIMTLSSFLHRDGVDIGKAAIS